MPVRGKYHKYTEAERTEIRRLSTEESKSPREIASALGFPINSIRNILYGTYPRKAIRYPRPHRVLIMETEVIDPMPRKISGEDLKRELKDLREENEYLKDKVAYLESLYEISLEEKTKAAQKKRGLQRYSKQ